MCCERGQATVEWTGLVALVTIVFGALVAFVPVIDGWSFGGWLADSILCAIRGGCDQGGDPLQLAYGAADAALVRRYAPNIVYEPGTYTLPIDYRRCRSHWCSDAPDRAIDVSRSTRGGVPAAAFTHVARAGGATFLQYWFYYPDSPSTFLGSHAVLQHAPGGDPAYHRDDWEGYQVRIDSSGAVTSRATAHWGFTYCKEVQCRGKWGPWTGWTRVSMGSHAGHIPVETEWTRGYARRHHGPPFRRVRGYRTQVAGDERTTAASDLELIPIETLPAADRAARFDGITPPWLKEVYRDPASDTTQ